MPIHPAAARGFEAGAEAYARGRPGYPPAAVDAALAALRLPPGAPLLELGAGTGIFSRLAAGRGGPVVALEPVSAMRARLAGVPRVTPVGAAAEALPFAAATFHGALAATAFHWFDGPATLRELHRVLRPGGRLVLAWNARDEAVDWIARLTHLLARVEGDAPRYRTGRWRAAFEQAPGLFAPLGVSRIPHVHALPPEGVVARIASVSFVAALPAPERARVLDEVRALLAAHPDTAGRAELGLAYTTDLWTYERA